MMSGLALVMLGVGCAVIPAGFGSAIGIRIAAQVASGALSEDPKNFAKYLMLVTLPGTQGIYGFIMGFLVIMKSGLLKMPLLAISPEVGMQFLLACLPVGFAGFISAIHQGKVCAAGIEWVSKQPESTGQALIYAVLVEFYAILGLLASLFMWRGIVL